MVCQKQILSNWCLSTFPELVIPLSAVGRAAQNSLTAAGLSDTEPSLSSSPQLLQLGTSMPNFCHLFPCKALHCRCSCLGWDLLSCVCGVDLRVALQRQSFTRNQTQLKPRTRHTHTLARLSVRTPLHPTWYKSFQGVLLPQPSCVEVFLQ